MAYEDIQLQLFILFLRCKLRRILKRCPQIPLILHMMENLIKIVNEYTPHKIKLLDDRVSKK
jgi:hypothetical protein